MGMTKISKDMKADLEKYNKELATKAKVNSKQKEQRKQKADKREERHKTMHQGIDDLFHGQMKLVDQIVALIKQISIDNEKIKIDLILKKKIAIIDQLGKVQIQQEKEFMQISKQKAKYFKKIGVDKAGKKGEDSQYELQSLLNESSSDEEHEASAEDVSGDEDLQEQINIEEWYEDIEAAKSGGNYTELMTIQEEDKLNEEDE